VGSGPVRADSTADGGDEPKPRCDRARAIWRYGDMVDGVRVPRRRSARPSACGLWSIACCTLHGQVEVARSLQCRWERAKWERAKWERGGWKLPVRCNAGGSGVPPAPNVTCHTCGCSGSTGGRSVKVSSGPMRMPIDTSQVCRATSWPSGSAAALRTSCSSEAVSATTTAAADKERGNCALSLTLSAAAAAPQMPRAAARL
jgi:hypothetical protein